MQGLKYDTDTARTVYRKFLTAGTERDKFNQKVLGLIIGLKVFSWRDNRACYVSRADHKVIITASAAGHKEVRSFGSAHALGLMAGYLVSRLME